MTEHVRTGYRNYRKATWAAVLVVLVVAALAFVLPAIGADSNYASDPVGLQPVESPLSGSNFTCASISAPHASQPWQTESLPSGQNATTTTYTLTATNGKTAKLTVTVAGGGNSTRDKYMSFRIVGGRISDIGLKGGSKTAWYHYGDSAASWVDRDGYGPVLADSGTVNGDGSVSGLKVDTNAGNSRTGLHATVDNQGNLYQLSWTTVCWDPVIKIEGYVYRDTNGNHTKDSGESGLYSRTVNVDGSPVTTSDGSDSSKPLGLYQAFVPAGTHTLCSAAQANEVQTQPALSSTCSNAGGYSLSYTSDTPDQNFGFAGGITASCTPPDGSGDAFQSQINSSDVHALVFAKFYSVDSSCKVDNKKFVFTAYTSGGTRVAQLSALSSLGGSCAVATTGVGCQIVAEKITWSFSTDIPDLHALTYNDEDQGGTSGTMKFCVKDPFNRGLSQNDGVTLLTGAGYLPKDILPPNPAGPPNQPYFSSCLARTTQYGVTNGSERVDEMYSAYDTTKNLG